MMKNTVCRKMRSVIFIVCLIGIISACDKERTLYPCKWIAAGGEFDSLTVKIERQFYDYQPFDSMDASIIRMYDLSSVGNDNERRLRLSRAMYWHSRVLSRKGDQDSTLIMIKRALDLCDSTSFRYDFLRMKMLLLLSEVSANAGEKYECIQQLIEYSKSRKDIATEGWACLSMGNLMGSIGEYDEALAYMDLADSLNSMMGFNKYVIKNQINRARVYGEIGTNGDKDREIAILKEIDGNPDLEGDSAVINLIHRNLYGATGEKQYILQAYNEIKENPRFRFLRGFYCGVLAEHNYHEGNYDSTIYYSDLALKDLPYIKEYRHIAAIWQNASVASMLRREPDSAYIQRIRYEVYLDSALSVLRDSEVLKMSAAREMSIRKEKYESEINRRNIITAFSIVLLVAIAGIGWLLFNRYRIRQRMAAVEKEVELEKTRRRMMASLLNIEEKDRILSVLNKELTSMREDGTIKDVNARRLESTIKSHLMEHTNDDVFDNMFDVVNPDFTKRLREKCPGLADSYVKLASYILMELDNRRIASLMMIRIESVHQARWRLARKLNLPADMSLDEYLRNLNDSQERR